MPNLIERRRMKRRMTTFSQSPPIYNIYYTESVPVQQVPNHIEKLAQSFPQLSSSGYMTFAPRTVNNWKNDKAISDVPFFPEEDQRRYSTIQYSNQALRPFVPILDRQQSLPQNLCNYGQSDCQTNRVEISDSRRSCDRPNGPNQHITLPTQPVGSNQGYSMKIEVLAKPLPRFDNDEKKSFEKDSYAKNDRRTNYPKIRESAILQNGHPTAEPSNSSSLRLANDKRRVSLLSKIKRKINRRKSESMEFETEKSSATSSAQEILSPRQLLESSTNVCSSIANTEQLDPCLYEPTDNSKIAATTFREALKSLEETLKIGTVQEHYSSIGRSDADREPSAMSLVCQSCKLKSDADLEGRSRVPRPRDYIEATNDRLPSLPQHSCELWKTLYPKESYRDTLQEINYNSRCRRDRLNDHSPPERDRPTRSLRGGTNSHGENDCPRTETGSDGHPPGGNIACCGLVMYGQNDAIINPVSDECCKRTIPVCGTVSRGLSPRYEPNFVQSPHYPRDSYRLRESMYRRPTYDRRDNRERFFIDEPHRNDRHRSYESRYRGDKSEFAAPPVLKSLAKAANMVLTSIFGKPTSTVDEYSIHSQPNVSFDRNFEDFTMG